MFEPLLISAAGAALCLTIGLALCLSGRGAAADRSVSLRFAVALGSLMPLIVLMTISRALPVPGLLRAVDWTTMALGAWGIGVLVLTVLLARTEHTLR